MTICRVSDADKATLKATTRRLLDAAADLAAARERRDTRSIHRAEAELQAATHQRLRVGA